MTNNKNNRASSYIIRAKVIGASEKKQTTTKHNQDKRDKGRDSN